MDLRSQRGALIVLALLCSPAPANWNDTPTGLDLKKLQRFHLTKIHSGVLKEGQRLTLDGILMRCREGELELRGTGKSGRNWQVRLYDGSVVDIYRGDLDNNGTPDYVFVGGNPFGNGRTAPTGQLTVLLMGSDNLPSPFGTSVYHEVTDPPEQIVDPERNGHAAIVDSTYDELAWDSRVEAFCSGHWTHRVYQIRDLKWVESQGSISGSRFPLVHPWTYYGTECPTLEKPWPVHPDRYKPKPMPELDGTIARILNRTFETVRLDPPSECEEITPGIVVYDSPRLRQIAFLTGRSSTVGDMLKNIKAEGARVHVEQILRLDGRTCNARMLWATWDRK